MAIEEEVDLYHYESKEKVTVNAKRTSKEGEYLARCISFTHEDKHPSMGINTIKGVYHCWACGIKGVTWEKHLTGGSKASEKSPEKIAKEELKNEILMGVNTDLTNWSGYDLTMKEEAKTRLSFDLALLPEQEKKNSISSLVEAGIFRKTELTDRIKKIDVVLGKFKDATKGERKEKRVRTKTLIPGLIHLVKEGEKISYLLQIDEQFYIEETHLLGEGITCQPKQDLPICYIGKDILEESREIDSKKLLEEIISFIKSYLELSENKEYLILALWVFHTYLIEKFNVTPIIYFYGLKETGKTRAGEVLEQLAFRCERLTSPTEATLFRSAEYFKTALIIDEIQLWGKNGNQEVERLIKSRYKRGLKVNRCNLFKSGEDQIEYFDVFAPLVISTTYDIPLIIQDRAIRFLMQKNVNSGVEKSINKEFARQLRNQLTVFRANYLDKDLKEVKPISRRRLNEIMRPLYQILKEVDPSREKEFKLKVRDLEKNRQSEEGFTSTAEVVEELVKFYNEEGENFLSTKELTDRLNKGKGIEEEIKLARVGWILKPLGFQKIKREGKLGYVISLKILTPFIERFNTSRVTFKEQSLFSP